MLPSYVFLQMQTDDILVAFQDTQQDRSPLRQAQIRTENGMEQLNGSAVRTGKGLLAAVQADRSESKADICRPLEQRQVKLAAYRNRSCLFRHNGDPSSNFYEVEPMGSGAVWVYNIGKRSLRFRLPDGSVYRVYAGALVCLAPSNTKDRIDPIQVLLDVGSPLDLGIRTVHVKNGGSWELGDLSCHVGSHVDSYFIRLFSRDDQLGVLENYSNYYLSRPALDLLDIDSYGPMQWYMRNKGDTPLLVRGIGPTRRSGIVPPNGCVYRLEELPVQKEEETV